MTIKPEIIDAMVAAGCTGDQIAAVVKAAMAKNTNAERQRRYRERHRNGSNVTGRNGNVSNVTGDGSGETPKQDPPKKPRTDTAILQEFPDWYAQYPHKVGKANALSAWPKARAKASLEELTDGLRRYIATKPHDCPYCHPATWLNGERWLDQPAPASGASHGQQGRPTHKQTVEGFSRALVKIAARNGEHFTASQDLAGRMEAPGGVREREITLSRGEGGDFGDDTVRPFRARGFGNF